MKHQIDFVLYQVIKRYPNHWVIAADGALMIGKDHPWFPTKKKAAAFVKKYYNKNFN
jgi:hypothetical protein